VREVCCIVFVCVCAQVEEAKDGDGAVRRAASEPDSQTDVIKKKKLNPSLPSSPSFLPFLSPFLLPCLPFPPLLAVLLHTHLTSHGDSTSDKRKAKRRRLEIVTATKSTLEESTSGLKFLFSYFFFNLFNPCSPRTLNSRIGYK
jgi:hypothetical protein